MGITLEDVLVKMAEFKEDLFYFLQCQSYSATDIENMVSDLEAKIKAVKGESI